MKGQPFEVACRGGSLLVNETRATRRGTLAWALWRSQIISVGCVVATADDDNATVYLHLRDGRRFAVEEVAPRDCFRLFELFGYEPEPESAAGAARAVVPRAVDLGDRHTRIITGTQGVRLEQDGRALLMLPRDQLLGVRVVARAEATKVQIVGRDGVATQLDDVPFAPALRLLTVLGVAPGEMAPLAPPAPIAVSTPDAGATEPPGVAAAHVSGAETLAPPPAPSPAPPPPITAERDEPENVRVPASPPASARARPARTRPARAATIPRPSSPRKRPAAAAAAAAPAAPLTPVTPHAPVAPIAASVASDVRAHPRSETPVSRPALPMVPQRSPDAALDDRTTPPMPAGQRDARDTRARAVSSMPAVPEAVAVRRAVSLLFGAVLAAITLQLARASGALAAAFRHGAALRPSLGDRRRAEAPPPVPAPTPARGRAQVPHAWYATLRTWPVSVVRAERAAVHEFATRSRGIAGAARHALPSPRLHRGPVGGSKPPALSATVVLRRGRDRAHRLIAHMYANLQAIPGSMVAQWRHVALVAALAVLALPAAGDALVAPMNVASHGGLPTAVQPPSPRPTRVAVPSASSGSVVYAGSQDGAIYALDAHTGMLLWRYDTGSPVEGGPIVAGGVIYAGEADGSIVALQATTHRELWRYHTGDIVRAAPAVANGIVYAGSSDDHLYALRAGDGTLLWRFAARDWFAGTPLVTGGMVYAGSFDGTLYALDARTGAEVWHLTTPGAVAVSPTIVNDTIYASSSDDTLYALDARTGVIRWRYTTGGSLYAAPVVANGVVYVGSCDTALYALRASDGTQLWQAPAGGLVLAPAVVVGQTVYVTSAAGTLSALRASDGAQRWRYTARGATAGPAVASGAVYTSAGDSSIFALDAQDGVLRWSYRTGGRVTSSVIGVSGS